MKLEQVGWLLHHPHWAPQGELEKQELTDADRKAGWTAKPLYVDEEETMQ